MGMPDLSALISLAFYQENAIPIIFIIFGTIMFYDIKIVKKSVGNHITDTKDTIKDIRKDQKDDFDKLNKRFDRLYEILLQKKTDNK